VINRALLEISRKLEIPLVVTNDVHYINREDAELQDVLLCIQTGRPSTTRNGSNFIARSCT
jgi:DNA polymerase-3 subunit alpha